MQTLQIVKKYLGMTETTHTKLLSDYMAKAGLKLNPSTTAWCSGFANAVIHELGMKGTNSLAARSWLNWGKKVDLDDAQPGDIVVFKRGNSSWQGHVSFFVKRQGSNVIVMGGNQSNKVNEQAYPISSILGVRRA